MIRPTLNRQQSRLVDELAISDYGMSGLVLMENAGRGVADVLQRLGIHGPVVICCGGGNNGGDGLVIARHLDFRGYAVRVLLWAQPSTLSPDAAVNWRILQRAHIPCEVFGPQTAPETWLAHLGDADWIVDALLGTGARGTPRAPLDAVIDSLNAARGRRLAVDVPSGLDCDTGHASAPTFRADHTCTFVAEKQGFLAPASRPYVGQVHVVDIGIPRPLYEELVGRG